jgi:hypothetical protein
MKKQICGLMAILISMNALAGLPALKRAGNKWLLHVDDKPFIILGGQVMNSSSFDLDLMDSVWPRMKALNLNTLIAPISWQAVEPVEGQFDFSLVDGLIAQAREQDMKLAILWFGTWKNARSYYVPKWVITDMERFPRMERKDGQRIEYISSLSENANAADSKAFAAFMRHLKAVDGDENTVVMVQIQNEVGLLGDTRDRSPAAEAAFAGPVPQQLIDYMTSNKDRLKDHLKSIWALNGYKTSGSWSAVFGDGIEADEIFMAWHYARYIDRMAAAGKAEHNLPMFANGWLGQVKHGTPGKYPSGGPVARMMDIWKAGGPNIDLLAADIYAYYKFRCENFIRDDNPFFVPEACALWLGDRWSGPAKAFYTIAEAQAIGFSPFGIDHDYYDADHPIGVAYGALQNLMPLIIKNYGTDNLRGFYKAVEEGEPEETGTSITIGRYQFDVKYETVLDDCYGLIMRIADNEFIIAGNGARILFTPADAKAHPGLSICSIEEGSLDANGEWVRRRLIGGGETIGTSGTKLPPLGFGILHDKNNMTIQRIKLYLHPPRKDGKPVYKTDTAPEF